MARNRKNQAAAVRFGPALRAFAICALISLAGLGYVWQQNQILSLNRARTLREQQIFKARITNKDLRDRYNALVSPGYLESQVQRLSLGLVNPDPSQVVRVTLAGAVPARVEGGREFAGRTP